MTDRPDRSSDELLAVLSDRYRMVRELGRGGMATVHLAEDLKHHRPVAIKVMRPELVASTSVDRFLREIEVAARLQHPHIVPLFDSGVVGDTFFYVMAYEDGESLRDRLEREKQLAVVEAIRVARQILDALSHAHDRGVIHRDVKPANILLSSGHAMLADFGIARAVAGPSGQVSTTGIAVGTPLYMSPEQSLADHGLDGRADIYSVGCVLYEMLAGVPPFSGPNAQFIIAAHRNAPLQPARTYRDAIPEVVDQAIARALAKLPADRYRTAAEFRDTLERIEIAITSGSMARLTPAQLDASPDVPVRPVERAWWRRPWVSIVSMIIVLTAASGGAFQLWRSGWTVRAHPKRVMLFPLHPRAGVARVGFEEDVGESASRLIGVRLASAPNLQFVEASEYLSGAERTGSSELTIARKRELSRAVGADYLIDGSIETSGTSGVTVVLRLLGIEDTIPIVKSADGPLTPGLLSGVTLSALRKLLPAFLEPGRRVDQSALDERDPVAIVEFVAGERDYRDSRFREALEHYEKALEHDTLLAVAALKAAQAASWLDPVGYHADSLADVAVRHIDLLAPWYATYARGLRAFLRGDGDAALAAIRSLTADGARSADAWFLLGETYFHLMPAAVPADSLHPLAERAFRTARQIDTSFSPATQHLLDLALRRGDVPRIDSLLPSVAKTLDAPEAKWLAAVADCVRGRTRAIDQKTLITAGAEAGWKWGEALAFDPARGACARAAARSAFVASDANPAYVVAAAAAINASLIAAGRDAEAVKLLTSPELEPVRAWSQLFVDAAAGADVRAAVKRKADSLGTAFETISTVRLWLLTNWYSAQRDQRSLRQIAAVTAARRDTARTHLDSLVAAVASAHLAAASADTASAIRQLMLLVPRASYADLMWQPWEGFAGERMLLARLYEARRAYGDAIRVASLIDAPIPIVNLIFIRQSLALRERASLALGDTAEAARYRRRLAEWTADRAPFP